MGGAGITVASGHQFVQLELERSAPVCAGPLPAGTEPEQLSELPASIGVCAEAAQEAIGQGGPGATGTFVGEYAALIAAARRTGAKLFFADEAHFRADAELRGKWVLKGKPALVDSSSPRYGEKAS